MNLKKQKNKQNIFILACLILLFTISFSLIYGITGHWFRSNIFLVFSLVFSCVFACSIMKYVSKDITIQLMVVYLFFSVFFLCAYFSESTIKQYKFIVYMEAAMLIIPFVFSIYILIRYHRKNIHISFNRKIATACVIFALLSLETLNTWTRLDTDIYYHYLQGSANWDFTFNTINTFMLGGHLSLGYTIWGLIGIFLTPGSPVGIRIINICLVILCYLCIYAIIRKLLENANDILAFLMSTVFLFNPIILGIIYEVNLDLPSTCFFIYATYSLLYNKKIFFFFSCFFLTFSKETGIILLAGLGLGWLIISLRKNFFNSMNFITLISFAFSPLLWLVMKKLGFIWRNDSLFVNSDIQTMDSFGYNIHNVIAKAKELFIANFNWISTLILLIGIIFICIKNRKQKVIINKNVLPIFASMIFFIIFQFIYITYCHMRYIMPYIACLCIILAVVIDQCSYKLFKYMVISMLLILQFLQSFISIDPVSNLIFDNINIGNTQIYTTRVFVRGSDNSVQTKENVPELVQTLQLTQSSIYNRQYMYFENVFQKTINTIEYDDNTFIALAPCYEKASNMTWISLFGNWYSNDLYYDAKTGRSTDEITDSKMNISVVQSIDEIPIDTYDKVYLFNFPYNDQFVLDDYFPNLQYSDFFTVSERGWVIEVYNLK